MREALLNLNSTSLLASLDPRGPVAERIADVWWIMFGLGVAVFVLFVVLLVIGLYRTRDSDGESAARALIVGGGTVLPLVVVTVIFGVSLAAMGVVTVGDADDPVVIEVTGHQWWWEVNYPNAQVTTANEIHIPVGETVQFHLTSADVVHSFWIPSLGGKLDLLPERVNKLEFSADEVGEYRGACAEFCGTQHAKMGFVAVAEPRDDFERWLDSQSDPASEPVEDIEAQGQEVFVDVGCGDCHAIEGTAAQGSTGPDLTHLASRETLAAATIRNTSDNLAEWVGDPHQIKEGVNMPNLEIGDEDMAALLAYLESLE
ncbi:MAG: cytochrome c oxidase subunit II [Acidimicrobiia bacterium]|nr:cytochrome c oxidase subunit II [Acidimicrobiia bacterium]